MPTQVIEVIQDLSPEVHATIKERVSQGRLYVINRTACLKKSNIVAEVCRVEVDGKQMKFTVFFANPKHFFPNGSMSIELVGKLPYLVQTAGK